MAARSAMRFLATAVVVLAVASFASAANNAAGTSDYLDLQLKGKASDYLDYNKRVAFCKAFTTVLEAGDLPDDVASCVINSVVDSVNAGEVTVTAVFGLAAHRGSTGEPVATVTTIASALDNSEVVGFTKGTGTSAQATALTGLNFADYQTVLEIAITKPTTITTTELTDIEGKITAALSSPDGVSCDILDLIDVTSNAGTGNVNGHRVNCTVKSFTQTRAEILTAVSAALKADSTYAATWVRDTGLETTERTLTYTLTATLYVSSTTAADIKAASSTFQAALLQYLAPEVNSTTLTIDTTNTVDVTSATGSNVPISMGVRSQLDANKILATLQGLIGATIGTTTNYTIGGVIAWTSNPGVFSDSADIVLPGLMSWYRIPIVNTTTNFTDSPSALHQICAEFLSMSDGNLTRCAIVEVDRLTESADGNSGNVTLEFTAANASVALTLTPYIQFEDAFITDFSLGEPVEVEYPGDLTSTTVAITVKDTTNFASSAAAVTSAQRTALCEEISMNEFLPPGISCSIAASDVKDKSGTTTNEIIVTARLWWRIAGYSAVDYLATLNQALVSTSAFFSKATGGIDWNTAITKIEAGATTPLPPAFIIELDLHVANDSVTLIDDTSATANANQVLLTNAISSLAGGSLVAWVKGVAGGDLTPAEGTLVTVRIFTDNATAQADIYESLQGYANGTLTVINSTVSTKTTNFTLEPNAVRRVEFIPAVNSTEFPEPVAAVVEPPTSPPATTAPTTSAAPATPPSPQAPVTAGTVTPGYIQGVYVSLFFKLKGKLGIGQIKAFLAQLKAIVAGIIEAAARGGDTPAALQYGTSGIKFHVTEDTTSFIADIQAATPADANAIPARTQDAINTGKMTTANVVSFNVVPVSPSVVTPGTGTPGTPGAPAVAPSAGGITSGNVDITILGTRQAFTTQDQNALTAAAGAAVSGTATVTNIDETSTNARKFTMQASALRLTVAMTAPAQQYPSVAAIVSRLQTVVRSQNGRLGNSQVVSIVASNTGAGARSGPVALTILVALLVAMLSAMAQF